MPVGPTHRERRAGLKEAGTDWKELIKMLQSFNMNLTLVRTLVWFLSMPMMSETIARGTSTFSRIVVARKFETDPISWIAIWQSDLRRVLSKIVVAIGSSRCAQS